MEKEEFSVPDLNIDPIDHNVDDVAPITNNFSPCETIENLTSISSSKNQQQSPHNSPQPSESNDSSNLEPKENPTTSSSDSQNQPTTAPVCDSQLPSEGRGKAKKTKATAPPPVPSLRYLQEHGIDKVEGKVECRKCEKSYNISYNVQEKFYEMKDFISKNKESFHNRAPDEWKSTKLLTCALCGEKESCKPVMEDQNFERIDWLFLFLGKFLWNCTLEQLKFFCKNNKIHRTGAKDRLVLYSYFKLCSQLEPDCSLFILE